LVRNPRLVAYTPQPTAQNTSLVLHRRAIDAAARYHTLLVEVERLTAVHPEPAT
jgi:hypothetical protein